MSAFPRQSASLSERPLIRPFRKRKGHLLPPGGEGGATPGTASAGVRTPKTSDASGRSLDAIVVLPNHLHAMMTLPEGDADYSGRWRRIKGLFSRAVPGASPGHRVWQDRFWEHTIRDDEDFGAHFDDVHFNPVRHGLVNRARDWPHSSFRHYVRLGWLAEDWAGDMRESRSPDGAERNPGLFKGEMLLQDVQ